MKLISISVITGVVVLAVSNASGTSLLNGDFETPALSGNGNTFGPDNPVPSSFVWKLASGDIDVLTPLYWQPSTGLQSIDLNGWVAGSIYQDFSFPSPGPWLVRFDMSANPEVPGLKTMRIDFGIAGGSMTSLGTFSLDSAG